MYLPENSHSNNSDSPYKNSHNEIIQTSQNFGARLLMGQIQITEKDKNIILQTAKELPLQQWLPKGYKQDQKKHWDMLRFTYLSLCNELAAFFSGTESTLINYPPECKEVVERKTREALDTYTLIRDGWFIIKVSVEQISALSPDASNKKAVDVILSANSPGELVAEVMKFDCQEWFGECLKYHENRPKYLHDLAVDLEKAQNLKDLNKNFGRELTQEQVDFVEKTDKKAQKLAKPRRGGRATILGICVACCNQYLQKNKSENLRLSLKRFEESMNDDFSRAVSGLHPSKTSGKIKNSSWNGGKLNKS